MARTTFEVEKEASMRMYEQIQQTKVDLGSGVWSSISDSAKEVVLGMLEKDVEQRLSCDEILSEWVMICFAFCKNNIINLNWNGLLAIGFNG